jgi:hypothetical protein
LPVKLSINAGNSEFQKVEKHTHQNAIQSKENGHFVCRTHQDAATNNIPLAIPFWFICTGQ